MILSRRTVALVACTTAVLGGCSSENGTTAFTPVPIVATTSIWADIASNVTCGELVPALIPAGADPHTFEPSLRDRELIDGPAVIIANGGGLEGPVGVLLDAVDDPPLTTVFEMTNGVAMVDDDPHIWQDPTIIAAAIDSIKAGAIAVDRDPDEIARCTADYRSELLALDAEITELLAPIASADRLMVTSHDSLAYFADRYDLEIVGTVIPSTNTLAETNAADLAALADTITQLDVRVVFTEQLESSNDANRLAERLGVRVVPLVTDSVTDDPATDTYVEMMRFNAAAIAEALAP